MKYTLLLSLLLCAAFCQGQQAFDLRQLDGKDTVYNESVKAKFYLYINDSTIKVVYGFHNYITHEHKRGRYWHEYVEPDFLETFYDDKGNGFYKTYPDANVIKIEDLQSPEIYNSFKTIVKYSRNVKPV